MRTRLRADDIRPESRLLLLAAGASEASAAREAWAEFRRLVPEGTESVTQRRFLPAVCRNLGRLLGTRDAGLVQVYAWSFGANASILQKTAGAVKALRAASIPVLALKGTALLVATYRDIGIRPMSDADLLVPESRIVEALEVLMAAGWRGDPAHAWLKTEMHAGTLVHARITLDLHRHALYEARYAAADEAFFADSRAAELSGMSCLVMSPEDQILHSIVHGLRWSVAPSDIWILDVITLLRAGPIDAAKIRGRAESLGLVVPLKRGLAMTRAVFGESERFEPILGPLEGCPEPWSERAEHWFRVREPAGILGALPNLWFAHHRSAPPGPSRLGGFPAFLSNTWGLGSPSRLPRVLLDKLLRRRLP